MRLNRPGDGFEGVYPAVLGVYAELCQDLILEYSAAKEKFPISL
jgi:hypothetical protein